jgi:hypothetical protein
MDFASDSRFDMHAEQVRPYRALAERLEAPPRAEVTRLVVPSKEPPEKNPSLETKKFGSISGPEALAILPEALIFFSEARNFF